MYNIDQYDNSIVISGFENGIADDPYSGLADMRNCNIISVPGEASVNFATSKISAPILTNIAISAASVANDTITFTSSPTLESYQAVTFSGTTLPEAATGLSATRTVTDGVTTSGDKTITSATINFVLQDLGKSISGPNIPAGTTIDTINSSTSAEMTNAASGNGTGLTFEMKTVYWLVKLNNTTAQVYSDYTITTLLNITATGTGTFSTVNMVLPKYFTKDTISNSNWMVDSLGQVWSDVSITGTNYYWTFTGNRVPSSTATNGNGIVFYQGSDGKGWIFVIHNSSIDYTRSAGTLVSWVYQWNPATGASAGYNMTPNSTLKSALGSGATHEAFLAPDNVVYFCDMNYIQRFFQTDTLGTAFDPTSTATYTYDYTPLLPFTDTAQCLAFLGTRLMVGGKSNVIYPWDTTSPTYDYPLLIAESNIQKMITINTNTYAFAGNRGRIYVTNGSQANLYKKVPDHISGTVEPYFTWGGVASSKNQLYFSFSSITNGGTAINLYGGIWAIDVDTKALRMTNKLSYGTYAGYASALSVNTSTNPAGAGLFIGWSDGAGGYGIDTTVSTLYINSEAIIETDLMPIGTFEKPRNFNRIEYKLTKPMVTGESITIKYRTDFSQSYATVLTDSTVGHFSLSGPVNFSNAQWVQFQIILNGASATPSYTRLKEIRVNQMSV